MKSLINEYAYTLQGIEGEGEMVDSEYLHISYNLDNEELVLDDVLLSVIADIDSMRLDDPSSVNQIQNRGYVATQKCSRITDLSSLQPGDHIAWKRSYFVWHHAIAIKCDEAENKLTVIHYSMSPNWSRSSGHFTSVREDVLTVNLETAWLYRFDYDQSECFAGGEVLERAYSRVGETQYNLVTGNCEHFARWSKTGRNLSFQSIAFLKKCSKTADVITAPSKPIRASCQFLTKQVRNTLDVGKESVIGRVFVTGRRVASTSKAAFVNVTSFVTVSAKQQFSKFHTSIRSLGNRKRVYSQIDNGGNDDDEEEENSKRKNTASE